MGWSLSDVHEEVLAGDAWVESPWSSYERPPLLGARSLPSDSIGWVPFDCAYGLLLCSWALFRHVLPVLLGCEPRSWMCVPLPVPLRPVSTWEEEVVGGPEGQGWFSWLRDPPVGDLHPFSWGTPRWLSAEGPQLGSYLQSKYKYFPTQHLQKVKSLFQQLSWKSFTI